MTNTKHPKWELEVLIATQNRTTLEFLYKMFPFGFSGFRVLVVNQTEENCKLKPDIDAVRIINTRSKGLSVSRNIALENCNSEIALIADDDLIYPQHFQNKILEAFTSNSEAKIISFQANKFSGGDYRTYPQENQKHTKDSIKDLISWEIAFNTNWVRAKGITFNERFGLGAEFETAEEYLFALSVIESGGVVRFEKKTIVSHPDFNSGMDLGSDRVIFARAALSFKLYSIWAYFWLVKYVVFLINHDYIAWHQSIKKYKVGMHGIAAYKQKPKFSA